MFAQLRTERVVAGSHKRGSEIRPHQPIRSTYIWQAAPLVPPPPRPHIARVTKRQQHLLQIAKGNRTILGSPKPEGYIWAIAHTCRKPLQAELAHELGEMYREGKLELERVIGWRDSPAHDHVIVYRLPKAPRGVLPRTVDGPVVRATPLCA